MFIMLGAVRQSSGMLGTCSVMSVRVRACGSRGRFGFFLTANWLWFTQELRNTPQIRTRSADFMNRSETLLPKY